MDSSNPLHTHTGMRQLVIEFLIRRDGECCMQCGEAFSAEQTIIQVKNPAEPISADNVQLMHRRCMYPAKPVPTRAKREPVKTLHAEQASRKLLCVLCDRKSEYYMANTCKHTLCEQHRPTAGSCPACAALAQGA